jgi:predicted dinucleotide-binding enzyme
MVVIATLWDGTANAIKMADPPKNLAGKIVIDVTNPLDFSKANVSNPLLDNFCA